ncbi:MAG: hypothetical protein Q8R26_01935 [bacterium]|nr:hypothetical protein [bacterium]
MSEEQERTLQTMHDLEEHRQREQRRSTAELEKCERLTQTMRDAEALQKEKIIRWLQFSEHYDTYCELPSADFLYIKNVPESP